MGNNQNPQDNTVTPSASISTDQPSVTSLVPSLNSAQSTETMPEEPTTPSAVETVIEPISTISVHSAPSDSSLQPQVSENPPQEASESAVPKEEPISENHDQTENQKTEISPSVQKPETSTALSETTPSTTPVSSQDSLKRVWSNTL